MIGLCELTKLGAVGSTHPLDLSGRWRKLLKSSITQPYIARAECVEIWYVGAIWVHESCWIVKIHFQLSPRRLTAPKWQ